MQKQPKIVDASRSRKNDRYHSDRSKRDMVLGTRLVPKISFKITAEKNQDRVAAKKAIMPLLVKAAVIATQEVRINERLENKPRPISKPKKLRSRVVNTRHEFLIESFACQTN